MVKQNSLPTLSSIGDLGLIRGIQAYQIGSRNSQPNIGIHAWTLNHQLNVTLAYAPNRFELKF